MEERLREEVEELNLTIKLSGSSFELSVDPNITLEEFKGIIEKRISVPSENISLIVNGRQLLRLESTLLELNVPRDSTIYLTVSRKDYIPSSVPLEPIGLTAEEKMMEQMMDNPMMASMLNNPELMKSIMESNPQMKKLLDANPQLRQIMSDPATMNEMMRTMRNPSLRREMMRNTDRTMSAIENMPGGFNELRKIYQQIQEPMENALDSMTEEQQQQSSSSSASSSINRTNDATPNTEALPNPWARPANNNANNSLFGSPLGFGGSNMVNMFGAGSAGGQQMGFPSLNDPIMQSILNNPELMNSIMSSMSGGLGTGLGGSAAGNGGGNAFGGQAFPSLNDPLMQSILNNPQLMNSILSSFSSGGGGLGGGLGDGFGGANPLLPFPSMNDPLMQSMLNNPQLMGGGFGGGLNGASFNSQPNATAYPTGSNPLFNPFLFGMPSSPPPSLVRPVPTNPASSSVGSPSQPATSTSTSPSASSQSAPVQSASVQPAPSPSSQPAQAQPAQTQSLEERYSIQISQMNEMGFSDTAKIIEALQQTRGDVERALELMFSM